ncbi:MAG: DUF2953 domain-containing protein [Clostridia bacterium]|nr:DUF2953 domain-containing protein [Clostridia bacterium]
MFLLYILGGLLGLFTVALLLPVSVALSYNGEFKYKLKIAFVTLNFNKKEKPKKQKKNDKQQKKTEVKPEKSFFEKLIDKKGFAGAVKEIFTFVKDCAVPLKRFLRFVKFRDIRLFIAVVGDDAAGTAVDYGVVCSAVYPTLSFIENLASLQYKSVDIKADFEIKKAISHFS